MHLYTTEPLCQPAHPHVNRRIYLMCMVPGFVMEGPDRRSDSHGSVRGRLTCEVGRDLQTGQIESVGGLHVQNTRRRRPACHVLRDAFNPRR
jgi:hypothetical protein